MLGCNGAVSDRRVGRSLSMEELLSGELTEEMIDLITFSVVFHLSPEEARELETADVRLLGPNA